MTDRERLQGKKIIFVFGDLEVGGAERQGLLLAEGLKERYGAEVQIWGLSGRPGELSDLCDRKGITWRSVRCGWGKTGVTRLASLAKLTLILRTENPDIILSYTAVPNLACGLVWRYTKTELFVWNQRDEGLLLNKKLWHRLAVCRTPYYLCNSVSGKLFLETFYGVDHHKVAVIHNGVAVEKPSASRQQWRQQLSLAEETPVVSMVANIHRDKDHKTLLEAWAVLHKHWKEMPKPVLLLAGRIDEGAEVLLQMVKDLGISEYVRFLGSVNDISGLLSAIELCVHSSRSEGLPNAVLEAMAAGIPVVGTDIAGIRDAVGPGGERLLVPVGDSAALATRLIEFLRDSHLRMQTGKALQHRIAQEFTPQSMCERTAAFLAERIPVGDTTTRFQP